MIRITVEKTAESSTHNYTKYGQVFEDDADRAKMIAIVEETLRKLQEGEK